MAFLYFERAVSMEDLTWNKVVINEKSSTKLLCKFHRHAATLNQLEGRYCLVKAAVLKALLSLG